MMVDASGQHDLLAAQCRCSQCGQNLSSMAYQRRVAHIKRCEPPLHYKRATQEVHAFHTCAQLIQWTCIEGKASSSVTKTTS